jgi:SdrD B-like domain
MRSTLRGLVVRIGLAAAMLSLVAFPRAASAGSSVTSLSGTVFIDSNNDGFQNPGENGIAGVAIALSGASTGNVLTDPNGNFAFLGIPNGTYTLTETQPPLFPDGIDHAGTANGTVGNDVISNIILSGGTPGSGYTFGELPIPVPVITVPTLSLEGVAVLLLLLGWAALSVLRRRSNRTR